jgi:hypothetical protein
MLEDFSCVHVHVQVPAYVIVFLLAVFIVFLLAVFCGSY